jgi:hypothetical protein
VGDNFLRYCQALTSVSMPATLTKLGLRAFNYTAIAEIDLSHTALTHVEENLLSDCRKLRTVALPLLQNDPEELLNGSGTNLVEVRIGPHVFDGEAFFDEMWGLGCDEDADAHGWRARDRGGRNWWTKFLGRGASPPAVARSVTSTPAYNYGRWTACTDTPVDGLRQLTLFEALERSSAFAKAANAAKAANSSALAPSATDRRRQLTLAEAFARSTATAKAANSSTAAPQPAPANPAAATATDAQRYLTDDDDDDDDDGDDDDDDDDLEREASNS